MKFIALLVFTISSLGLFAQTIPSVDLKTLDGTTVNIQEFSNNGKITVLSFWATWCAPCKRELDIISKVYDSWQKDYNAELIAISIDEERVLPRVKSMVKSKDWKYTVLSDMNQELMSGLEFQSVPMTFLVNQDGKVVYTHAGFAAGDEKELEEKIKELAGK